MRSILWVALTLILLGLGYYYIILDSDRGPYCHKQINLAFITWMEKIEINTKSEAKQFPNVNGNSSNSLNVISNEMNGYMEWAKDYRYIPGLNKDDPGDLILMYFERPTRWTWHITTPTIFTEKAWIVVPVDFTQKDRPLSGLGELSERVSASEFRTRLKRTLDFLRENNRPNWEQVVAEHSKLLDSLGNAQQ